MKTTKGMKFLSLILSVLMVISTVPLTAISVNAQTPAGSTSYTVIACGDFQYPNSGSSLADAYSSKVATLNGGTACYNHEASKLIIENILETMADTKGITSVDCAIQTGDFHYNYPVSDNYAGIGYYQEAISGVLKDDGQSIIVHGNHDVEDDSRFSSTGNNDPSNGAYGVYVINEDDFPWDSDNETLVKNVAEGLRRYLNNKLSVGYTAPIFIVTHVPLYFTVRTVQQIGGKYAGYLFDVLNDAAEHGLNIVMMSGHNHSQSFDDYMGGAEICYQPGDNFNVPRVVNGTLTCSTEEIKFTYLNSGYVGYYENYDSNFSSAEQDNYDLTMTSYQFDDTTLEINRYSFLKESTTTLKAAGKTSSKFSSQELTYTQPQTNTIASGLTIDLTGEVDTDYEIPAVVHTAETSSSSSSSSSASSYTYERITSVDDITDDEHYLLLLSDSAYLAGTNAFLDNTYATSNLSGFEYIGPVLVSSGISTLTDEISGNYTGYEWGIAKSGTAYTLTATTGEYAGKELKATSRSGKSVDSGNYDLTFEDSGSAFKIATYDTNTFSIQDSASNYYFRKSSRCDLIYGYGSLNTHIAIYRRTSVPATECDTWYEAGTQDVTTTSTETPTLYYTVPSGEYSLSGGSGFLESSGTSLSGNSTSQTEAHEKWTFTKLSSDSTDHTYTITDENGKYLNISSSGVSLSTTAQTLTLIGNSDGSFTISDGNGHYLYKSGNTVSSSSTGTSFTAYTWTSTSTQEQTGTNYTYTLDTDGIDTGSSNMYLIVAGSSSYILTHSGSTVNATSVTITNNTITLENNTSDWYFSGSSSTTIRDNDTNYYVSTATSSGGNVTASTSSKTYTATNAGSGAYRFYNSSKSGKNTYYYYPYYNSGWKTYRNTKTTNSSTYNVRLFKLTSETPVYSVSTTYDYIQQNSSPASYQGEAVEISTTNTYIKYAKLATHDTFSIPLDSDADAVTAILRDVTDGVKVSTYLSNDSSAITSVPATDSRITFDTSNLNTSVAGNYTVDVKYNGVTIGTVNVNVPSQAPIASVTLSQNYGSVYLNTGSTAKTGAYLIITRTDGTVSNIPVSTGMLVDLSGNQNAKKYAKALGTYTGLGVYYSNGDGYWFDNFTLKVIEPDDYPEYPDEGSVKVGKSGTGMDFQTTGVAQVELTATGVPKNPGVDLVIVMDTSSSMNNSENGYYNGQAVFGTQASGWFYEDGTAVGSDFSSSAVTDKKTRLKIAEESLSNLLVNLNKVGEDGMSRDIDVAICTFNGMTYIDGEDNANYFTDASTYNNEDSTAAVMTGDGTYTENGFQNITELQDYDTSIIDDYYHSGTNYDKAFQSAYELVTAKKEANKAAGEDRDLYIIFMSDGCPFQYNYFGSNYGSTEWNNWIAGTYEDTSSFPLYSTTQSYFYNGLNNKHRMAEALKGATDTLYTIIDPTCTEGEVDVTGDGVNDPYMKQIYGLGAKMYSIAFCIAPDNKITVDAMNTCIENVATSEEYFYKANSPEALDTAFSLINNDIKEAATEAYFVDTMGPAYDLQLRKNYTVGDEEKTLSFDPEIVVTNYTVYTRADYLSGTIDDLDQIGTRVSTATPDVLETVTFNADGTEAYSDQIDGGATNILVNNVINAETFIYNNNKDKSVLIDRDGDGVEEYTLAAETFCWKIGIIADTEYALSYYVYLTGSMEGERDAGSYATNTSAVLYYKNYLGNDCHKDTVSPILPWQAATVNYEFYLVNANGQPVNSSGTVVPFENRVKIGLTQSKTILLNSSGGDTAYTLRAASEIPEGYNLFNDDAEYYIFVGSGSNASRATITDTADIVTTYYYEANYKEKVNGDVSQLTDPGNTHVAFAVLYETTAVPDTVVVDFGLPTAVHALANDIAIPAATEVNAIGTALTDGTQTGATAYTESRLTSAVTEIKADRYTATVDGRNVKVQLSDMLLDNAVTFYYEVKIGSNYYYSTITVIPAQNIYYEEDFITFTDANVLVTGKTETLKWSDAGTLITDALQDEDRPGNFAASNDANNPYGSDTAYNSEEIIYSMGNAKVATVCAGSFTADKVAEAGSSKEPYATFNFVGTGFDLISATTAECGCAWVKVINNTTNTSKTYIINTYYGYSYGRAYRNAEGKTTLRASYTDENGNVVYNAPLYDCIDVDAMQPVPTYHDVTDGKACDTVSYYATNSTDTYPVYTLIPTYYDENGNITTTVTDEPAYAYAYAYSWMPTEDASDALYQVPVVCIEGLDYGSYTVKVTPKYAKSFDLNGAGEYKFYIDGVRIYDPCGTAETIADSKETVNKAYYDDNEANAQYFELRDNIINANDLFVSGDGESTNYGIYIDGFTSLNRGSTTSDTDAMDKYKEAGPNNEVYLSSGQAIAFNMEVTSTAEPASVQIGAKVVKAGADGKADGKLVISNSGMDEAGEISVLGCTAMYRDITPYLEWDSDYLEAHENTYKTLYPVVIINNSDCIISLTNIKYSLGNSKFTEPDEFVPEGTNSPMLLTSSAAVKNFAVTAVQKYTYSAPDEIDTADITAEWNSDDFAIGAEAVLTITTPSNVEKVQVGNEEITEYTEGENGTRIWTYKVIVTENTDGNYTVTFTDSIGRVSDAVTTDPITVEAPEQTESEQTEETEEQSESPITKLMRELLEDILDALKSLFSFLIV